jgi:hypothetical protein
VCARKTGLLAQRVLWRKPGVSADYPGFFINILKIISAHFVKKKIAEHAQYSLFFTSDHFL